MPRLYPLKSNFSAGEWTPKLDGQVTLDKYANACSVLENFTILQQGGIQRRAGTKLIAACKRNGARHISFVSSVLASYMLEVGPGYIRFYRNRARIEVAGVPVEVATDYSAADLRDIDTRQSVDVLYFFHPSYPAMKLERYSDTQWRFRAVTFDPPPSFEYGARPVFSVTPSATSGTVTLTAAGDSFLVSDVGREVLVFSGTNAGSRATVTVFTSRTQVDALVTQSFVDLSANAAGTWKIATSPRSRVVFAAEQPVGTVTTLTGTTETWRGFTNLSDSDCGRFFIVNGGEWRIDSIASRTVANATVVGLPSPSAAGLNFGEPGAWQLTEAIWSCANGFAETASFHEDRLYIGGRYWLTGSKSSDYENFAIGINDDDAVVFAINTDELPTIRWLAGQRRLLIGANGAEFTAFGSTDAPISPSNIQISQETAFGSNGVVPVRAGGAIIFTTRSGTKLREFVPDPNSVEGNFVAPDLLLLAEHLTSASQTIVELAYRREPVSTIWAIRSDGQLLGCTYLRDQNIIGWHEHTTDGDDTWRSVATLPTGSSGDETWLIARRVIGGVETDYVEVMDEIGLFYDQLNTDCTHTCDSAVAVSSFAGLTALEGRTVSIVGDGAVYPDQVVTAGTITLDPAASQIEVGLPYTSTMTTMRPEIATGAGTLQPMKKRWVEVFVRFLNSLGATVTANNGNAQLLDFRRPEDPIDEPPPVFTGDKRITTLGWDDDAKVTIQQTQPLPCTVLLLSGILDVGA